MVNLPKWGAASALLRSIEFHVSASTGYMLRGEFAHFVLVCRLCLAPSPDGIHTQISPNVAKRRPINVDDMNVSKKQIRSTSILGNIALKLVDVIYKIDNILE